MYIRPSYDFYKKSALDIVMYSNIIKCKALFKSIQSGNNSIQLFCDLRTSFFQIAF